MIPATDIPNPGLLAVPETVTKTPDMTYQVRSSAHD